MSDAIHRLVGASSRSDVPPFMVMDEMAAAAIGYIAVRPVALPQVTRFEIHAPAGSTLPLGTPAISPDGRTIAYTMTDAQGVTRIHVRPLDRVEARALPGTENAVHPFWLADSRSLAFATVPDNYMKQIDVDAGSPRTLFKVLGAWHGTANQDGTLLFLDGNGLNRWVAGEKPTLALKRREGEGGGTFPFFLPDGKRFLMLVNSNQKGMSIQLATLGEERRSTVLGITDGAALMSRTPRGKSDVLFVRNTDLVAQEFDEAAGLVRGSPKVIVNAIGLVANPPRRPAVSAVNGVLAYQTGGVAEVPSLTWVNRSGAEVQRLTRQASVRNPQLSADGERLLGSRFAAGAVDIWMTDLRRGAATQITFSSSAYDPVWSRDGRKIAYRRINGRAFIANADGSGEREVADRVNRLWDWSPDGQTLLASLLSGFTIVRVNDEQKPIVLQPPRGTVREGYFSPNGRYIAFVSDESGRDEVYIQAMPPASFRTKISINGGVLPRWRADGKELFFVSPDSNMMSVNVNTDATFSAGIPRPLFTAGGGPGLVEGYAVRADGQQFLMPGRDAQAETWPITVVLNWWAELE